MKHESYAVFPGRQHYVTMVPPKFAHLFLEGVQSIDSNPNTEDQEYGQYGYTDPVIVEKAFKNETGSLTLNHYGYAQRVLRAMAGQNPETTFLYDKSYNGKVDFWENVYNKTRDKVVNSRYWFDAVMSTSHASTLDDVETYTLDFTATRCLEFEGKQIVPQTFANTVKGQKTFQLDYAAIIDPAMNDIRAYTVEGTGVDSTTIGSLRHELCPIQYAIRVWVDGRVLADPNEAAIITQQLPTTGTGHMLVSTLYLKEPLAKDGQIVKVMYLADGAAAITASGVSAAPLMVQGQPLLDTVTTPGTAIFKDQITVQLSRSLSEDAMQPPAAAPGAVGGLDPTDFILVFEDPAGSGTIWNWPASTISYGSTPTPSPTSFFVSGNVLVLDFVAAQVTDVNGVAAPAGTTWNPGVPAELKYVGNQMTSPQEDGWPELNAPEHSLNLPAW